MSRELLRLLESHDFLKREFDAQCGRLPPEASAGLQKRIDKIFLDILLHAAEDPRVTLAQVRFLLSSLVELTSDPEKSDALREACQRHFNRLQTQISDLTDKALTVPQDLPQSRELRYLDSLTDRVGILDREYRYRFLNRAGARLHGKPPGEFIGRPNWTFLGEAFFREINKPRFDACFAGQSLSFVSVHPNGDPETLYAVNIDPVRDPKGRIDSLIVVARQITSLALTPEPVSGSR